MINIETPLDRRAEADKKYRPGRIRLLLVAEAPPGDEARYFYFEDVQGHDSLFRHVVRGILGVEPTRVNKSQPLEALTKAGVFLIDASPEPIQPGILARGPGGFLGFAVPRASAGGDHPDQGERLRRSVHDASEWGATCGRRTDPLPRELATAPVRSLLRAGTLQAS